MRCKTKQRKGSRPTKILGYRRITANENSPGIRRNPDEMNDHQREQSRRQNSAYRHRNYEGRFRKRRRPSLLIACHFLLGKGQLELVINHCRPNIAKTRNPDEPIVIGVSHIFFIYIVIDRERRAAILALESPALLRSKNERQAYIWRSPGKSGADMSGTLHLERPLVIRKLLAEPLRNQTGFVVVGLSSCLRQGHCGTSLVIDE